MQSVSGLPQADTSFISQLMDILSDGLFMVDTAGRICEVNGSLCRLMGYERHELLGRPCSVLGCDTCAAVRLDDAEHWCALFEQKLVMRRRCHLRHKNGTPIPVLKNARLVTASPASAGQGEHIFSVESITDISEIIERDAYISRITQVLGHEGLPGMMGQTPCMEALFHAVQQAAMSDAPVFIQGESGSGKELVARSLHQLGPRRQGPFISLNCAALNKDILESELFGHVRGAFTGAVGDRVGRFEAADGGTLFLDEIGDMPLEVQVKLLRVLESGQIERVGDHSPRAVDVRIVSATHRNLDALISEGRFREDLAYRVRVIPLHVPPLRQRREDIPLLVAHFLEGLRATGKDDKILGPDAIHCLMGYNWPGNVRELRNAVTYAVAMSQGRTIGLEHLPQKLRQGFHADAVLHQEGIIPSGVYVKPFPSPQVQTAPPAPQSPRDRKAAAQRTEILAALAESGNNVSQAARSLGIHRTTLINRMLRLGLRLDRQCREI